MPFPGGIGGLVGGLGSLLGGGHPSAPSGTGQLGTMGGAMQGLTSGAPPMHPALSPAQFKPLLEL